MYRRARSRGRVDGCGGGSPVAAAHHRPTVTTTAPTPTTTTAPPTPLAQWEQDGGEGAFNAVSTDRSQLDTDLQTDLRNGTVAPTTAADGTKLYNDALAAESNPNPNDSTTYKLAMSELASAGFAAQQGGYALAEQFIEDAQIPMEALALEV